MNTIQAITIVVLKEMIRRKDFYVLFIITALITLIMGSINIFNDQSIAGYLKELALLLVWACSLVIAIATTARQLYSEKENRTIFPLLAKPVSFSICSSGWWLLHGNTRWILAHTPWPFSCTGVRWPWLWRWHCSAQSSLRRPLRTERFVSLWQRPYSCSLAT
jgi:uncharacterized membrane protein YhaH (DUF805 family)